MISLLASAVQTHPVSQPTPLAQSAPKSASKAEAASAPTDTVKISSAAAALLKEATETVAQTAKEAGAGDVQAQKLRKRLQPGSKTVGRSSRRPAVTVRVDYSFLRR